MKVFHSCHIVSSVSSFLVAMMHHVFFQDRVDFMNFRSSLTVLFTFWNFLCNIVYHFKLGWPLQRQLIGPITSIPRFSSYRGRCEGQKDQLQLASQTHQIGDEDPRNLTESSKCVGKNWMISSDSVLKMLDTFKIWWFSVRIYNDYIYIYVYTCISFHFWKLVVDFWTS